MRIINIENKEIYRTCIAVNEGKAFYQSHKKGTVSVI